MSAPITVTGNATKEPELKFSANGAAYAKFSIAVNQRVLDKTTNEWKDGETTFFNCVAWRQLAENVAGTVSKGMRITVTGKIEQNNFETKEGVKVTSYQVVADDVAVSIKNSTARVERNPRREDRAPSNAPDPWAAPSDSSDLPPF